MLLGGVSCEWYTPWTWFAKAEEVKVEDPVDKLLNYNKAEWLAKIESAEKQINGFPQISEDFKVQVQTCQSTQDLILQSVTNILNKAVYVVEMPNNEPFVSYFEVKAVPKPDPKEDVEDGDKPEPSEGGGGSESIESGKEEKPSEKPTEEKSEPAKETTSSSEESGSQEGTSEDRESSSERHHRILTKSRDTSRNYNQILVLEKILHRLERRHRQEGESLRESSRGGKDGRTSTEIRR